MSDQKKSSDSLQSFWRGNLVVTRQFVAAPRQLLLGIEQLQWVASHSSRVPILWSVIVSLLLVAGKSSITYALNDMCYKTINILSK